MESKSKIVMKGHCQIWDATDGTLLRDVHNIITCGGCTFMAGYLSGGSPTAMTYMAVGSATTSAAAVTADTDLEDEIDDGNRHACDIDMPATTSVRFSASYPAGHHTGNWVEAGIANAIATDGGTLLSHALFGLLTKAAGDAFILAYTISFGDDGV